MTKQPPKLCEADLRQFSGDFIRYKHPLNSRVIYTPGVRHVAVEGQAYWLIDAIASWIGSKVFRQAEQRDERISWMHFWTLEVKQDQSAVLVAKADSPEKPFIRQEIEFTDFPLNKICIWAGFDGSVWTLYLPSEH